MMRVRASQLQIRWWWELPSSFCPVSSYRLPSSHCNSPQLTIITYTLHVYTNNNHLFLLRVIIQRNGVACKTNQSCRSPMGPSTQSDHLHRQILKLPSVSFEFEFPPAIVFSQPCKDFWFRLGAWCMETRDLQTTRRRPGGAGLKSLQRSQIR